MYKTCKKCSLNKLLTDFFRDKTFKDGRSSRCKACKTKSTLQYRAAKKEKYNEYMKAYRAAHPDTDANKSRDRRKSLRLRYGITQGEYDQMLLDQGGTCALCDVKPNNRPLHVDHCHNSGRVRGLLCAGHNRSIAILDDPELLAKAQAYLLLYAASKISK